MVILSFTEKKCPLWNYLLHIDGVFTWLCACPKKNEHCKLDSSVYSHFFSRNENLTIDIMFNYIYIYIYCHPQTDCFVVSLLFSVARHVGHLKLGLKSTQLYVKLGIRPLGQQAYHVSSGIIMYYTAAVSVCLHFMPYRIP